MTNDERVHHYQRGRASITGLGLWSRKIIETERLVVVVTARLVRSSFSGDCDDPKLPSLLHHGHPNRKGSSPGRLP